MLVFYEPLDVAGQDGPVAIAFNTRKNNRSKRSRVGVSGLAGFEVFESSSEFRVIGRLPRCQQRIGSQCLPAAGVFATVPIRDRAVRLLPGVQECYGFVDGGSDCLVGYGGGLGVCYLRRCTDTEDNGNESNY